MSFATSILVSYWKVYKHFDCKRIQRQKPLTGINEVSDVPYIDDGRWEHKLDILYPENAQKPMPVIVDIHGGGWMYGFKEINRVYAQHLAQRGFTVFNINYRLAPEASNSGQLQDIAEALNYISNNLNKYPCSRENIYLTGDSAGGQLALYTAMLSTDKDMRDVYGVTDSGINFNAVALTSPVCMKANGLIGFYLKIAFGKNRIDFNKNKYSDINNLAGLANLPPVFLVTSSGDGFGRRLTVNTYNLLRKAGVTAKLMNWPKINGKNLHHVFSVLNPQWDESCKTIDEMLSFFKTYEKTVAEK